MRLELVTLCVIATTACNKDPAGGSSATSSAPVALPSASAGPLDETARYDFKVVAEGPEVMELSSLRPKNILSASSLAFEIEGARLRQAPELSRGAPKRYTAQGRFPDAAWLVAHPPEEGSTEPGPAEAFHWVADRWVGTGTVHEGESFAGISSWSEGRALALVKIGAFDVRFALVGGKGPVALPAPAGVKLAAKTEAKAEAKPAPKVETKPEAKPAPSAPPAAADDAAPSASADPQPTASAPVAEPATDEAPDAETPATETAKCKTQVYLPDPPNGAPLETLRAFESGEVMRVGFECRSDGKWTLAVERWAAKQTKGTITTLPEAPLDAAGAPALFAASPSDAYAVVYGAKRSYLAHASGDSWTAEKLPFQEPIVAADMTPDGTLWLATKDTLWRRAKGNDFARIKVAALESITRLSALTNDDVWMVGTRPGGRFALVHNGATGPTVELPTGLAVDKVQGPNKRAPATAACANIYVHIRTLGATGAKPPKAFPDIEKAAAGLSAKDTSFVIEDDGSSTYLGAQVTSMDAATKLTERLAKLPGKSQIFCHLPKVKAKVEILK
jgi:hypothetical protein